VRYPLLLVTSSLFSSVLVAFLRVPCVIYPVQPFRPVYGPAVSFMTAPTQAFSSFKFLASTGSVRPLFFPSHLSSCHFPSMSYLDNAVQLFPRSLFHIAASSSAVCRLCTPPCFRPYPFSSSYYNSDRHGVQASQSSVFWKRTQVTAL
jgi:hypothetical protein